jgi:hypothetical protein
MATPEGRFTKLGAVAAIIGVFVAVAGVWVAVAAGLHRWPFSATPQPSSSSSTNTSATSSPAATPTFSSISPLTAAPCTLDSNDLTCSSSNPQVVLELIAFGNTTGCSTEVEIQWGDTSAPEFVDHLGGAPGPHFLANHTYATPGTYTIDVSGTPLNGCTFSGASYTFTLL